MTLLPPPATAAFVIVDMQNDFVHPDGAYGRAGIRTPIFGGIVTNGGVALTVRDAHVRDFQTIVLANSCAAFSQSAHEASIATLATISEIATVEEIVAALGG